MRKIVTLLFCILLNVSLFSQEYSTIEIISPVEGTWYNKQQLVINQNKAEDYYYSLNGEDPFISGFAYDGPVLLEIDGDITLRVKNSLGIEKIIHYTVIQDNKNSLSYNDFINSFVSSGEINYVCGTSLDIPSTLNYSIDMPECNTLKGRQISLSEKNVYSSMIPIIFSDEAEGIKWRFILNIFPQQDGISLLQDVPFKISDWENLSFVDKNLIYKVDNNYWQAYDNTFVLDRNIPHSISWQSINYEKGNPIETFILPPKQTLVRTIEDDGQMKVSFPQGTDKKYKIDVKSNINSAPSLYSEIFIDAFEGQKFYKNLQFDIYYDCVYQGTYYEPCAVNKTVPDKPEFILSNNSFRLKDLSIKTVCNENSRLFIAVSEPYELIDDDEDLPIDFYNTLDLKMGQFLYTYSNEFESRFQSVGKCPVLYKVQAYSYNGINASEIVEYAFIIENNDYYVDESTITTKMDGSKKYPFNNLATCLENTKNVKNPVIKLIGKIHLHDDLYLENSCLFQDYNNSEIILGKNASFNIKNSKVSFSDCSISLENNDEYYNSSIKKAFIVEDSTLSFENTIISANFDKNGIFIDSNNSTIKFTSDCICSINGDNLVSFITSNNSDIIIDSSLISANGLIAVLISASNSRLALSNNVLNVTGNAGRACELFNTDIYLKQNEFKSQLDDITQSTAIYKDENSNIIVSEGNEYYGF